MKKEGGNFKTEEVREDGRWVRKRSSTQIQKFVSVYMLELIVGLFDAYLHKTPQCASVLEAKVRLVEAASSYAWQDVWIDRGMYVWIGGLVGRWMGRWVDKWTDGCMYGCMDGCEYEWMDAFHQVKQARQK